jgi:RHS repeat-associated protein
MYDIFRTFDLSFMLGRSVMGTWSDSYDTLNRLLTATAGANVPQPYAGNFGCWIYDAFGNRTSESMSTTACASNPPLTSWAAYYPNNRIQSTSQAPGGVSHDRAGDVTNDGLNQYLYDGEGRICAVASTPVPGMTTMTGYLYDAAGTRVAKGTISAWSCDPTISGFKTTNDYVLGLGGEQAAEMGVDVKSGSSSTLAWQHTNVYAAGALIGTYDNNGLHFYLNDPLGTRRVQTDSAGVVEQTCQSLPYGDGLTCTGGDLQAPTEHHFTGKERDTESGNDYFGARYYSSAMGRWMSPDPLGACPSKARHGVHIWSELFAVR